MRIGNRIFIPAGLSLIVFFFLSGCEKEMTGTDRIPISLEIRAPSGTTYSGGSIQLEAIAAYENGTEQDVTVDAVWTVSPGTAGTVTDAGLFSAFSNSTGSEAVTADYQGQSDSIHVTIVLRSISFAISPAMVSVEPGGTLQFQASAVYPGDTREFVTEDVDWSIHPGTAGTIDTNGFFQAQYGATGIEKITGRYQGRLDSATVQIGSGQSIFDMVTIPAGSFWMGDDDGWSNELPAHLVATGPFEIGRYEVTNAEYADYLNAANAKGDLIISSGIISGARGPFSGLIYFRYNTSPEFPDRFIDYVPSEGGYSFVAISGVRDYPVVRITWYGAAAFCAYYGLRLPTEAEWEKACRGGQDLEYGTEDGTLSHDLANYLGVGGLDVYEGLAPVGSFPANPYGCYDMCGNAAEFVFDVYDAGYYYHSPGYNPTGPGPEVVLGRFEDELSLFRGGSWISYPFYCRSSCRSVIEDQPDHNLLSNCLVGFRVAR